MEQTIDQSESIENAFAKLIDDLNNHHSSNQTISPFMKQSIESLYNTYKDVRTSKRTRSQSDVQLFQDNDMNLTPSDNNTTFATSVCESIQTLITLRAKTWTKLNMANDKTKRQLVDVQTDINNGILSVTVPKAIKQLLDEINGQDAKSKFLSTTLKKHTDQLQSQIKEREEKMNNITCNLKNDVKSITLDNPNNMIKDVLIDETFKEKITLIATDFRLRQKLDKEKKALKQDRFEKFKANLNSDSPKLDKEMENLVKKTVQDTLRKEKNKNKKEKEKEKNNSKKQKEKEKEKNNSKKQKENDLKGKAAQKTGGQLNQKNKKFIGRYKKQY
jgi:hypothetical protein